MPTQLLAVATGAANSADLTVTTETIVSIKDAAGGAVTVGARIDILRKDDAGEYFLIGSLSDQVLERRLGPGTYRATRPATSVACGAIYDAPTPLDSPARRAFDAYASRSDSVDLSTVPRAIYTGSGGNIKVTTVGGDTVTFVAVPAGSLLPVQLARLWSTGTTVTDCLGLY